MYITTSYSLCSIYICCVEKFKFNIPFVHSRILVRVMKSAPPGASTIIVHVDSTKNHLTSNFIQNVNHLKHMLIRHQQ